MNLEVKNKEFEKNFFYDKEIEYNNEKNKLFSHAVPHKIGLWSSPRPSVSVGRTIFRPSIKSIYKWVIQNDYTNFKAFIFKSCN